MNVNEFIIRLQQDAVERGQFNPFLALPIIEATLSAERNAVLDRAIREIRVHQDIVGWQPGESRNALIQEIEDAVAKLKDAGE